MSTLIPFNLVPLQGYAKGQVGRERFKAENGWAGMRGALPGPFPLNCFFFPEASYFQSLMAKIISKGDWKEREMWLWGWRGYMHTHLLMLCFESSTSCFVKIQQHLLPHFFCCGPSVQSICPSIPVWVPLSAAMHRLFHYLAEGSPLSPSSPSPEP